MIGKKQDQEVGANSLGVQSGGDANINIGTSSEDVRAIIETLADQLPKYAAIAATIVDQRLKEFEERVLNRFESDSSTRPEAFQDPDFQYLIGRAQHAFARSGDEDMADSLAELIAERSRCKSQSRLSLSLNGAVERVPLLTSEEFAELSATFIIRRVKFHSIQSFSQLAAVVTQYYLPVIFNVSKEENSYLYLESIGCGKLSFGSLELYDAWRQTYPSLMNKGATEEQLAAASTAESGRMLIDAGLVYKSGRDVDHWLPHLGSEQEFSAAIRAAALDATNADRSWQVLTGTALTKEEITSAMIDLVPNIADIALAWNESPLKSFEASSVGLAIGFSNLARVANFKGNIGIWIG